MKIAVCDDERIIREQIKDYLKSYSEATVFDYSSGKKMISSGERFDLIFLDIEMDDCNGMDIAAELRWKNIDSHIVFLTSHDEFMAEAFKVKAFRFLTKPVKREDFDEALKEAEKEINSRQMVYFTSKGANVSLWNDEIVYIESSGDGTILYDCSGKSYIITEPIKYWESILDRKMFYRIHKSYIVSLKYIKNIEKTKVTLLYTDSELTVSRRNMTRFREAYINYIRINAKVI